jgi:hypothetical protein
MTRCPACGLVMPPRPELSSHAYYHASAECWNVYSEVLGAEYANAVIFGQVHQLTVDAYAVQHAGGAHPDKSVGVHLAGLYFVIERGVAPALVPPLRQKLVDTMDPWPHFHPPEVEWPLTVYDVAVVAGESEPHVAAVRAWSRSVWDAWREHHAAVEGFAAAVLR